MIEIIPFNKDIFDTFQIECSKITRYTYINNTDLICKLSTIELPISNRRLALRNIFDFLTFIDTQMNHFDDTIIPLDSRVIISFFSKNTYKKYMDILSELNVMTTVPYKDGTFYKSGSLYLQYRIHNEYLNNEDLAIITLEDELKKVKT